MTPTASACFHEKAIAFSYSLLIGTPRYGQVSTDTGFWVDHIHDFYETLRGNYPGSLPKWSKEEIYNYLYHQGPTGDVIERQSKECIRSVYKCIEYLRGQLVEYEDGEGTPEDDGGAVVMPESSRKKSPKVDYKAMKMMADMCKVHAGLIAAKKGGS